MNIAAPRPATPTIPLSENKDRHAYPVCCLLLIVVATLALGATIHDLRAVCFDDTAAAQGWSRSETWEGNLALDHSIGRFYAVPKFAFLGWLQAGAGDTVRTLVRLGGLGATLLGAAAFARALFGPGFPALGTAALMLACYPLAIPYQALLSNPLLTFGFGAVTGSAALLAADAATHSGRAFRHACALLLFAAALLCHELFLIYLSLHVLVYAWPRSGTTTPARWSEKLRVLLPFCLVAVVYAGLLIGLRLAGRGAYEGVALSPSAPDALRALFRFSASASPGFEFLFDRAATGAAPLRPPGEMLALLREHLHLADPAAAGLAAAVALLSLRRLRQDRVRTPLRHWLPPVLVCVFLILLPNLLIALTTKYQIWALIRRIPYYYGFMGLYFLWALAGFVWMTPLIGKKTPESPPSPSRCHGAWELVGASLVFALVLIVAATNRWIAAQLALAPFN